MANFPNSEFPISSTECAEIEAIFIELMRKRDASGPPAAVNAELPLLDPYGNPLDLRS